MSKLAAVFFAIFVIASLQQIGKCQEKPLLSKISKYGGYAGNAFKVGIAVYNGVKKLYGMIQPKTTQESESDKKQESGMEQRITDQVKKVSKQISSLKVNIQNVKTEIIDKILTELPEEMSLRDNLYEIYLRMNQVENLYENFEDYVIRPNVFSNSTLEDFAVHATSHDLNELPNVLKTIHWMLVQTDTNSGESILSVLSKNTQSPGKMCKRQQSLQQMLILLYDSIATADIKGHTMIQFSFMLLETIKGENKTAEIDQARQQFATRISNTMRSVKKALASASRVVWKCDSDGLKEDVTYTRFNNLITKYMVNEADLNADGTCRSTCPAYDHTKVYGCYNEKICKEQRTCAGDIWDCEHKISGKIWVCPSENNSNRRYEYIEYGNSQRYGLAGTCKSEAVKISSWNRGTVECTYCTCTCDDVEYSESDRYVNLHAVDSNYHDQYVVTGLRLRKVNHMLHLQIQQGKLLPEGLIDESTVGWKELVTYKVGEPFPESFGLAPDAIPGEYRDYTILKHKEERRILKGDKVTIKKAAFNLDDLDFTNEKENTNHVVVGVKFGVCDVQNSGEHIELETIVREFNFTTGEIDLSKAYVYSKCRTLAGRDKAIYKSDKVEVKLHELDVPTEGAASTPTSQTNQFLYLKPSSMETDAGQNTLPFLDIQDVETYPHVPLSGVGLFHKSSPGTGGFLSLKLFTYNYEPHFVAEDNTETQLVDSSEVIII